MPRTLLRASALSSRPRATIAPPFEAALGSSSTRFRSTSPSSTDSQRRPSPTMPPMAGPSWMVRQLIPTPLPARCTSLTALAGHCSSIANCARICCFASDTRSAVSRGSFIVNPSQSPDASQLFLLNSGHQDYREFLTMMRWRVERTHHRVCQLRSLEGRWRTQRLQPILRQPSLSADSPEPVRPTLIGCAESRSVLGA